MIAGSEIDHPDGKKSVDSHASWVRTLRPPPVWDNNLRNRGREEYS